MRLRPLIAGMLTASMALTAVVGSTAAPSASAGRAASAAIENPSASASPLAHHTLYRVGGIDCDGRPQHEAAGTVTLARSGGELRVTIEVRDTLYPAQAFTVEAWEHAPGCYPDNALVVPGAGLTTDSSGAGGTSFTLPFPYARTFPDGSTVVLGDGAGSENLVVVLDRTGSTGAGDSYAAGPLPIPADEPVDEPVDTDGDGVPDDRDSCVDSYPGYPVDGNGCARPLEIDWEVPDRFTGTPASTPGQVRPGSYPAVVKVGFPDGRPCDPAMTYRFRVAGSDHIRTGGCDLAVSFDTDGSHVVEVHATAGGRPVALGARAIRITDLLLVVLGDSVAAGEGNPGWQDSRCHRSAAAGALGAAAALERADRRSSVTVVHLACTGASINAGLLGDFAGITSVPGGVIPAQVGEAKRLIGPRRPDAVLVSVGANDVGFATILNRCLLIPFHNCAGQQDALDRELNRLAGAYARLASALTGILGVAASDVYLTEYFTPLRDERSRPCQVLSMSASESEWADRNVVRGLNAAIATAAARHGWRQVTGVYAEFGPHGYCASTGSRWIRTLPESLARQGDVLGAFHPNEAGQRSYARHVERSLRHLVE